MRRVLGAVAVVTLAFGTAGCDSSPKTPPGRLFHEYLVSTDVKNDRYRGATAADRLAEFAAEGGPRQAEIRLLGAVRCDRVPDCDPDGVAAGPGTVYRRNTVVKRRDGSLELMPLYVVRDGGDAVLVDDAGQRYRGGLDDFRAHNSLLTSKDEMLTVSDVTAVTGRVTPVVVTGHTAPSRVPWLLGGVAAAAVVLVVAAGLLLPRLRRAPAPDPWSDDD